MHLSANKADFIYCLLIIWNINLVLMTLLVQNYVTRTYSLHTVLLFIYYFSYLRVLYSNKN